MAFPITITIYGCDTNNDGVTDVSNTKTPTKTDVEALSGVVSTTYECGQIHAGMTYDTEDVEYFGNLILNQKTLIINASPQSTYFDYPSSNITLENYYGSNVLSKKYTWVYFNDYPIQLHTSTQVLAIRITAIEIEHDNALAKKRIKFEMEAIKAE
jgi:hypothetical protein